MEVMRGDRDAAVGDLQKVVRWRRLKYESASGMPLMQVRFENLKHRKLSARGWMVVK